MDKVSRSERSRNMARIRSRDTKPELIVRRLVYHSGYRYRLHAKELPGKPDLVFRAKRKVIFVHGCFWHRHSCPNGQVLPQTRTEFWKTKFAGNIARDAEARQQLRREDWKILIVWECETRVRDLEQLQARLVRFLGPL